MFDKYNYWIIRNLKYYRNSTIPTILINRYGIEKVESELCKILKRNISISWKDKEYMNKKLKCFRVRKYEAMEDEYKWR